MRHGGQLIGMYDVLKYLMFNFNVLLSMFIPVFCQVFCSFTDHAELFL